VTDFFEVQGVIDALPELVLIVEPDGHIVAANAALCQQVQRPREQVVGVDLGDLLDGATETPSTYIQKCLGTRQGLSSDLVLRTASGATIACFCEGVAIRIDGQDQAGTILLRFHPKDGPGLLSAAQRQFAILVNGVIDYAIFMLDPEGRVASWNAGARRIKGYADHEIIGRHFSAFYTAEAKLAGEPERMLRVARENGRSEAEGWRVRKDGTRFWANVVIDAIRNPSGNIIGYAKVTRDLTERRAHEERLRQAQKMEAVGQLTGGIAHDFNNLLTIIGGNIESLQRHMPEDSPDRLRRYAENSLQATRRAGLLTQRLLAFSRRQPLAPKPVNVNKLVSGMSEILIRTLGEDIEVETVLAGRLWMVEVDPNQLESAILNLAVNARDAMGSRGKLTIETANGFLDEAYAAMETEVKPGQYVAIAVTDTGSGMPRDVAERAFEPFFTTKPIGQGTGLGLSQVYGFVKQSGGHVKIYSEAGEGTSVKIYLPRSLYVVDEEDEIQETVPDGNLQETILVVEDDEQVRAYSTDLLQELGYRVIAVVDGPAALRQLELHPGIKLLFTDVGLRGMNGRELANEACKRWPRLKVLFTTGYARNAIVHQGRLDDDVVMIGKPFTYAELAARVRDVLDREP
jgi:PAS domain S-box-containing protein